MKRRMFKPGDRIVVCRRKHKSNPSRRAEGIQPSANGDDYCYYVRKFWVVAEVLNDGRLLCRTPRGKKHVINADDPSIWHAGLLDRIIHRNRFLQSEAATAAL